MYSFSGPFDVLDCKYCLHTGGFASTHCIRRFKGGHCKEIRGYLACGVCGIRVEAQRSQFPLRVPLSVPSDRMGFPHPFFQTFFSNRFNTLELALVVSGVAGLATGERVWDFLPCIRLFRLCHYFPTLQVWALTHLQQPEFWRSIG